MRFLCLFILILLFYSCANSNKAASKQVVIEKYFNALNNNNPDTLINLFYDSIRIGQGDYWSVYSQEDYINWLKWDAVFSPQYEILKTTPTVDGLEVTISKKDTRILFLHKVPVISTELFRFKEDKLLSVEITSFVEYNDKTWNTNKEKLILCIKQNQPDLDGFIYDQTEAGGKNYLRAIEVYATLCQ